MGYDEDDPRIAEWWSKVDEIGEKFPKVCDEFLKEYKDHAWSCEHDPYYRHCHGGGIVPIPCCKYCAEYDGNRCMKEWNNADPCYYIDWRDDKEPDDLCEGYEWNNEWEDD